MEQNMKSMARGRMKHLIIMAAVCACLRAVVWAEPVKLIVDTDMYTDIDSGAVALAHVLADRRAKTCGSPIQLVPTAALPKKCQRKTSDGRWMS